MTREKPVETNFRIGCAIWAYKGWLGDLFPLNSRPADFLRLYGDRFTTVEGNTTFYSIPNQETVARWAAETPGDFKFCLKLPKSLTHSGLLQPSIAGTLSFLDRMSGLGDRLGPLFAQLPPSYGPEQFNDLTAFLAGLPRDRAEFALEVRHPDWFKEPHASQLTELLQSLRVGRVLLDSRPVYHAPDNPQLHSQRQKPNVPLQPSVTAAFSLIRLISHPELEMNQRFLHEWVRLIDPWLRQGIRIYFFVHCPIEARSPTNARYFQHLLERQNIPVSPLPWDRIKAPIQLDLFSTD